MSDLVTEEIHELMAKDELIDVEQIRLHLLLQPTPRSRILPRWLRRLIRRMT